MVELPAGLRELLGNIGHGPLLAALVERVDAAIVNAIPVLGTDESIRSDLSRSTEAALRGHLGQLTREGALPVVPAAPPEARQLGRAMAQRGLSTETVLQAFRVAQRTLWQDVMDVGRGLAVSDEDRHTFLTVLWNYLNDALDQTVDEVVASHSAELRRRWTGATAKRQRVVRALLDGEEEDTRRASADLGHRLSEQHLAAVLWWESADDAGPEDVAEALEVGVRRLGAAVPDAAVLAVPAGEDSQWVWLGAARPLAVGEGLRLPDQIRVALGRSAPGIEGFRRSHDEARQAQAVASASRIGAPVTSYDDVELVSLVWADPQAARQLVRRQLGQLAEDSAQAGRLRRTLLVHLNEGSSARAAAALNVHKNTVLYRLAQVEERRGRPLSEAGPGLHVALLLAEHLGATAWSEAGQPGPIAEPSRDRRA